jgi:ABC-type multidrug transport system fused ATPase/permease subunit
VVLIIVEVNSIKKILKQTLSILNLINTKKNNKLAYVYLAILVTSLLEVLSIGIIVPYMNIVVGNSTYIFDKFTGIIDDKRKFITFITIFLVVFFIIKTFIMHKLYLFQIKYIFQQNKNISVKLLKSYLEEEYSFFIKNNTNKLIKNLTQETIGFVQGIMLPLLVIITELTVVVFMLSFMLYINYMMVAVVLLVTIPVVVFILKLIKKRLINTGDIREKSQTQIFQNSEEILNSYREIKIYQTQDKNISLFSNNHDDFSYANVEYQIYNFYKVKILDRRQILYN